jgi:hypothetical protein
MSYQKAAEDEGGYFTGAVTGLALGGKGGLRQKRMEH